MTAPLTPEALVEGLAQHYREGHAYLRSTAEEMARALVTGPLAPLLAAHQQITAERDEARTKLLEFGEMYDREDKRIAAEFETVNAEADSLRAENEKLNQEISDIRTELDALIQEVLRNG